MKGGERSEKGTACDSRGGTGYRTGSDPPRVSEEIYTRDCASRGPVDRGMLYVYRCAVYYASHELHNPALLRWWNWKDGCQKEDSDE